MKDTQIENISNISLEAIFYDRFFRDRGLRIYNMLIQPRFSAESKFELPKESIVHYLPTSLTELGPAPNDLLLRRAISYVLVSNVLETTTKLGNPTKTSVMPTVLESRYRSQYRTIRPLKKLETGVRDENSIVVFNYAMIDHLLRYRATFQTGVFKFRNKFNTFVDTVNDIASKTHRNQFLTIRIPKLIPTKQQFIRGAATLSRETVKVFSDDESLTLLELWIWLSSNRENGILSKLTPDALKKLNLVVLESGKFVVINMGLLNSWRTDDETNPEGVNAPAQMQISFLKFLDSIQTLRSVAAKSIIETVPSSDEQGDGVDEFDDEASDSDTVVSMSVDGEEILELEKLERQALEVDEDELDIFSSIEDSDDDDVIKVSPVPVTEVDDPNAVEPPKGDAPLAPGVIQASEKLLEDSLISAAEHRRFTRLASSYTEIPNPFGEGTLADAMTITPETLVLDKVSTPKLPNVFDESMLTHCIGNFDRKYIGEVLNADVVNMVMNVQNSGIAVTDYRVARVTDFNNDFEVHEVKLTPVGGAPSTVRFKLPKVKLDGSYRASGVNYRLRKQRGPLPIVKINPHRVALTSYYSKMFVERSQKKVHDYGSWLMRQMISIIDTNPDVKIGAYGNFFVPTVKLPRTYTVLARRFKSISYKDFEFMFSYTQTVKELGDAAIQKVLKNGEMIVGTHKGNLLLMGDNGNIYEPKTNFVHGTFEEILGLDISSAPVEIATLNIMGKAIPIGIALAQHYGLTNLLRIIGAEPRQVLRGSRMDLSADEYAIKFADVSLVLSRDNRYASLIAASFNAYSKSIALFDLEEFDSPAVYSAIMERENLGVRYSREIDLMFQLYIDHITKDLLAQMGEPTEFGPLLMRAVQLLVNDDHPRETQGKLMRIKGYERFSGAVYAELVKGIRRYKARPLTARSKVDVNPNAVWLGIQQDSAVSIIEESNPIHALKEKENVTYSGTGGRTSRTMVRRNRAFDPEDIGVISEATVDNADVAVTVFTTADPKISNLRGITADFVLDDAGSANFISTTAMVSPDITRDDPKRALMASIQASHVVAAEGYRACPVRTGYENIIAHRSDDLFAYAAQDEGYIADVGKDFVVIKYKSADPSEVRINIGRRYGVSAGTTVPHDVVCDLPKGHKFQAGDILTFNSGFMTRDYLNPTQVVWMAGIPVRVMLIDNADTLEDSCAISADIAEGMRMSRTEVREINIRFDQGLHNLVRIGETVETDSILCTIEDAITAGMGGAFSSDIDSLSVMSRDTPRAKVEGVVGRIEILYNGDFEDMTPTLRDVIGESDKRLARLSRVLKNDGVSNGRVVDMDIDTAVIRIYIDDKYGAGDGEKVVFGHQLKSMVRRVMIGTNETKDGLPIGAFFAYSSISNRMTNSPEVIGTTAVVTRLNSERMAKAYRSGKP